MPRAGREHQHLADRHPDRRRGAAQQPPRLPGLGQAFAQVVRVRHRLGVHPHARVARPRHGEEGGADAALLASRSRCATSETLQAVIANRYDVLARYGASLKHTYSQELERLGHWSQDAESLKPAKRYFARLQRAVRDGARAARRGGQEFQGAFHRDRDARRACRALGSLERLARAAASRSCRTGAIAPRRAAWRRSRSSASACAATPSQASAKKKPARSGLFCLGGARRYFSLPSLYITCLRAFGSYFIISILSGRGALVLGRGVEVAGAGRGFELDLFAHGGSPQAFAAFFRALISARTASRPFLSMRAQARGRHAQAHPAASRSPARSGGSAGSAGSGAWSCCWRAKPDDLSSASCR